MCPFVCSPSGCLPGERPRRRARPRVQPMSSVWGDGRVGAPGRSCSVRGVAAGSPAAPGELVGEGSPCGRNMVHGVRGGETGERGPSPPLGSWKVYKCFGVCTSLAASSGMVRVEMPRAELPARLFIALPCSFCPVLPGSSRAVCSGRAAECRGCPAPRSLHLSRSGASALPKYH